MNFNTQLVILHVMIQSCKHMPAKHPSLNKSWVTNNMYENMHASTHPLSRGSLLSRCPVSRWSDQIRFWILSVLLRLQTTLNWTNLASAMLRTDPTLYALQLKPRFCARIGNNRSLRRRNTPSAVPDLGERSSQSALRGRPFVRAAPLAQDSRRVQRGIPKTIARGRWGTGRQGRRWIW